MTKSMTILSLLAVIVSSAINSNVYAHTAIRANVDGCQSDGTKIFCKEQQLLLDPSRVAFTDNGRDVVLKEVVSAIQKADLSHFVLCFDPTLQGSLTGIILESDDRNLKYLIKPYYDDAPKTYPKFYFPTDGTITLAGVDDKKACDQSFQ